MKISITREGVFADGVKINNVTRVDVMNLNPIEDMEVVLHIAASEIEVNHKRLGVKE